MSGLTGKQSVAATAGRAGLVPRVARPAGLVSAQAMKRAGLRIAGHGLLPALLLLVSVGFLRHAYHQGVFFFDFEGTIFRPILDVVAGDNPYPAPQPSAVDVGNPSVYPPIAFLLWLPLAALPFTVAGAVWAVGLVGCVMLALRLMGVGDWRCYAVAVASLPVLHGVVFGNLTLVLVLGAAAAWRWRDRPWLAGLAVGITIALKLFLWPLLPWLLLTRRFRAGAVASLTSALVLLASWAAIGFAGMRDYPALLSTLTAVFADQSLSVYAVVTSWGLGATEGQVLMILAAGALLAVASRRRVGVERDRRTFVAAIGAAFIASPIVWPHYFALMIVLLPLVAVRLSWVWLLLSAMWASGLLPYEAPATVPCCRPDGMPNELWRLLHGSTPTWHALVFTLLLAIVVLAAFRDSSVRRGLPGALPTVARTPVQEVAVGARAASRRA